MNLSGWRPSPSSSWLRWNSFLSDGFRRYTGTVCIRSWTDRLPFYNDIALDALFYQLRRGSTPACRLYAGLGIVTSPLRFFSTSATGPYFCVERGLIAANSHTAPLAAADCRAMHYSRHALLAHTWPVLRFIIGILRNTYGYRHATGTLFLHQRIPGDAAGTLLQYRTPAIAHMPRLLAAALTPPCLLLTPA